jgi:hypothetical protein
MGSPGFELESPVRGYFRAGEHEVIRAPQPCQEILLEQMSDGALARMRPDLSIGAALPPAGRQRPGGGSPGAWVYPRCAYRIPRS